MAMILAVSGASVEAKDNAAKTPMALASEHSPDLADVLTSLHKLISGTNSD